MSFDWLPGVLAEIAEVAGLDAALAVARAKGGGRAYIPAPAQLNGDHWLVQAIGDDLARAVAGHFQVGNSGHELMIPLGPAGGYAAQRRARARAVLQAIEQNCTIDEAARMVGVDRSTIIRAKQRLRDGGPDSGQGSLF